MMQIDILSFKYQANLTYFDKKKIVHIEIQTLKPALIADIARLADVGTATVDRVLNGPASVCPATCPPHFLWWAESFKINGLTPPQSLWGFNILILREKMAI